MSMFDSRAETHGRGNLDHYYRLDIAPLVQKQFRLLLCKNLNYFEIDCYRAFTVLASRIAALSTSSSLDQRPNVRRRAPRARSRDRPIAVKTVEGSVLPSWQAEPVELAISGVAARTSSPITPSILTLSVLGRRSFGCPLRCTEPGKNVLRRWCSCSRKRWMRG